MPDDKEVQDVVAAVEAGTDEIAVPGELLAEAAPAIAAAPVAPKAQSLYAQIATMSIPEKIKLALRGNKDARMILVGDANKVIRRLVLQNPRITDPEVLAIARSKTADEEVLRKIADAREWQRFYAIRLAIATNPKTPLVLAMRQLGTLTQRDLQQLAKSRNIPQTVAAQARRMVMAKGTQTSS